MRPRIAALGVFVKIERRHTYFLPLIDEMRARKEGIDHRKGLAAFHTIVFTAVARDDARVVVVFEIVCIPRSVVELCLPLVERLFELYEIERRMHPVDDDAIRAHVLERDHHVKLFFVFVDVGERGLDVHKRSFAHLESVVLFNDFAVFLQIFVDMRPVVVVLHTP